MRKFILGIILFFACVLPANASTTTYNRLDVPNMGVNKKIEITSYNKDIIASTPLVDASEKIYDYADIFSEVEEANLYARVQSYIKESKMDMVILTTSLAYSDEQIENYSADFYDYNDFGLNLEHYSGILVVINMNSYNRFYNIYTFGNALLYYNNSRLENMLDSMYNYMLNGNYYMAANTFIQRSLELYEVGIPSTNKGAYINELGDIVYPFAFDWKLGLIVSSVVTLVFTLIFVRRNKMVKKATKALEYMDGKSYLCNIRNDKLINTRTTSYVRSSSSGGSYGGRSGGFSSSSRGSSGRSHGGGSGRHF